LRALHQSWRPGSASTKKFSSCNKKRFLDPDNEESFICNKDSLDLTRTELFTSRLHWEILNLQRIKKVFFTSGDPIDYSGSSDSNNNNNRITKYDKK
jgi:hypothetical protein